MLSARYIVVYMYVKTTGSCHCTIFASVIKHALSCVLVLCASLGRARTSQMPARYSSNLSSSLPLALPLIDLSMAAGSSSTAYTFSTLTLSAPAPARRTSSRRSAPLAA